MVGQSRSIGSRLLKLRANLGQRHRNVFKRRPALVFSQRARVPAERPHLRHAQALQKRHRAEVVRRDVAHAVAVVRERELAAELQPLLRDESPRVRLREALAQRGAVALEPRAVLGGDFQIPQHALPDALPLPNVAARLRAQQADEVKVAHDARAQRGEHVVLQVVVVLVQRLLGAVLGSPRARGGGDGGGEHGGVVVDGDAVDVVHGADEVVDAGLLGEGGGEGAELGTDELGLEADDDVDLRGVGRLQALGFGEVGGVAGGHGRDGGLGVVELSRCVSEMR